METQSQSVQPSHSGMCASHVVCLATAKVGWPNHRISPMVWVYSLNTATCCWWCPYVGHLRPHGLLVIFITYYSCRTFKWQGRKSEVPRKPPAWSYRFPWKIVSYIHKLCQAHHFCQKWRFPKSWGYHDKNHPFSIGLSTVNQPFFLVFRWFSHGGSPHRTPLVGRHGGLWWRLDDWLVHPQGCPNGHRDDSPGRCGEWSANKQIHDKHLDKD